MAAKSGTYFFVFLGTVLLPMNLRAMARSRRSIGSSKIVNDGDRFKALGKAGAFP